MNKLLLSITILILFTFNFIFAQAPEIEWQNTIGGIEEDLLYSIQQTNDGGYIFCGNSSSGISGDKTESLTGGWIVKIDNTGQTIEWQKTIGGYFNSIQQISDGGYIIGGSSDSGWDYSVVKLDNTGQTIEWQNTIGGNNIDNLHSIQQTTDSGYILGGSSLSGISGDKTEANQGWSDYWVVKLDNTGQTIEWQNTIGGNSDNYLNSIQQTSDGGYILGGYSNSGISGDKTEASQGGSDYWVVKLDNTGQTIEWQNTIGGSDGDILRSIQQTSDGGYILGGFSSSGISGDKTEANQGGSDYWIVKLDNTGQTIEWQNTIGGSEFDRLRSIQQTSDSGYILGGFSNSGISGDKTEESLGFYDYWVVKLTSNGTLEWQKTIGGSDYDDLRSIQQTSDDGYILGGYSGSGISGNKTEVILEGWNDYWVVKLAPVPIVNDLAYISGKIIDSQGNPISEVQVEFSNGGQSTTTDDMGFYDRHIPEGWNGTATPSKGNLTFEPTHYAYSNINGNNYHQDFVGTTSSNYAYIQGHIIDSDGNPISGVLMEFSNGGQPTTTDEMGFYDRHIAEGWNGTATPSKGNLKFEPTHYTYTNISGNNYHQDFVAATSGNLAYIQGHVTDSNGDPISGVLIEFSNGGQPTTTDEMGFYDRHITEGWHGTATPGLTGYSFEPSSINYAGISGDNYNQDFVARDLSLGIYATNELPIDFTVLPAYPNPFNPNTTIRYGLDSDSYITVAIYDITGQLISTLFNDNQSLGWHNITWSGTNQYGDQVPAGLYFSKITSNSEVRTNKLMLLK